MITLIHIKNPLSPVHAFHGVKHRHGLTVAEAIRQAGITHPCRAWLGGEAVTGNPALEDGARLVVVDEARDPVSALAFFFLDAGLFFGAELATATFIVNTAGSLILNLAFNAAISLLTAPDQPGGSGKKSPEAYSLSNASNQARAYRPLPVVLGSHRMLPDYGQRFWTDYVTDYETGTAPTCGTTPVFVTMTPSPFNTNTWQLIENNPDVNYRIYADSQPINSQCFSQPHTFIARLTGLDTNPDLQGQYSIGLQQAFGTTQEIVTDYQIVYNSRTQRLNLVFNYGFGDITIAEHKIGKTDLADYKSVQLEPAAVSPTGTLIGNWTDTQTITQNWPTIVDSERGAELLQNANVLLQGWVERQGGQNCTAIEIDFSGRLFKQGSSGAVTLSANYEIQYKPVTAPDTAWVHAPISPLTLSNATFSPLRRSFRFSVPSGHYAVRVRKTTPDETQETKVNDVVFEQAKFFRTDTQTYPAQNRIGLSIKASGQLQGTLDQFSSLVTARTWVYTGGATWDGTLPGASANWTWMVTDNPAWWYLYFALGGYLNPSTPIGHPLNGQGWMLGEHPDNASKLFGAGLAHARIDYAQLCRWAAFCAANTLDCNAVVDTQQPVQDVLQSIASAGRASMIWAGGKLGIVYIQQSDPAVTVFGMPNIIKGSFSVAYAKQLDADEVVATYIDRDKDYGSNQVRAVIGANPQPVTETQLRLFGVTTQARAQREANLIAASQQYHRRRITWETSVEGLIVRRGDVVQLAHDLTAWAHSARIRAFIVTGDTVTGIRLDREIEDPTAAAPYHLQIRLPDGELLQAECTPPIASTDTLTLTTGMFNIDQAAGWLDEAATENPASLYLDSAPRDYIVLAGPLPTPGKRVRVLAIEPLDEHRFRFTATDEVPEYYAAEYA